MDREISVCHVDRINGAIDDEIQVHRVARDENSEKPPDSGPFSDLIPSRRNVRDIQEETLNS